MDKKLEDHIIMMQYSIEEKKATYKKHKYADTKLHNIDNWMIQKRIYLIIYHQTMWKQTVHKIISVWYRPTETFYH